MNRQQQYQAKMKAEGRCRQCGQPADGYARCQPCRKKLVGRARVRHLERLGIERLAVMVQEIHEEWAQSAHHFTTMTPAMVVTPAMVASGVKRAMDERGITTALLNLHARRQSMRATSREDRLTLRGLR